MPAATPVTTASAMKRPVVLRGPIDVSAFSGSTDMLPKSPLLEDGRFRDYHGA
jgi:hypothetical protein